MALFYKQKTTSSTNNSFHQALDNPLGNDYITALAAYHLVDIIRHDVVKSI